MVLAPLGAVSLLWNALLSRLLLGDLFSPTTMIGTLLIATGATLIAVFGVVAEPNHSLDELLVLFARAGFVAYFVVVGVAVAAVLVIVRILMVGKLTVRRISLNTAFAALSSPDTLQARHFLLLLPTMELQLRPSRSLSETASLMGNPLTLRSLTHQPVP